jgi:predicted PurR-regulated permease PerM
MPSEPSDAQGPPTDQRRFLRRVMIAVGVVGLAGILAAALGFARDAMLTIFGGVLMGVLLDGVACRIATWTRMPRWLALALVCLLAAGALVGLGFWLGPAITEHVEGLRDQVAIAWQDLLRWMRARPWGPEALEQLSTVELSSLLTPRFGGWLSTTAGTAALLLLMVVFGFYFAIAPDLYLHGMSKLLPIQHRPRMLQLMSEIGRALRSWLVGRFVSMSIIGAGTALGLWAVGVPLGVPLGILAGLLSFVPNVGPIMSAIPGVLVAFAAGPSVALWALLVYAGVQAIESYVLEPIVQQKVVSLPPALLLSFQLLMGLSSGVIGLFIATPLLVTIVVIVQSVYVRELLGDDVTLIGEPKKEARRRRLRRSRVVATGSDADPRPPPPKTI